MNDRLRSETTAYLHEHIPLTRAMGVRVESWDGKELVLAAPLEPNHNHLGTAFGGSLAAVATLAGYSLLWLCLGDRKVHIVIRRSALDYRRPVRGEIRAVCRLPDPAAMAEFRERFERSGKARIELHVSVEEGGAVCVGFDGVFVALR